MILAVPQGLPPTQHLAQSEQERNDRAAAGAPRPPDELLAGERASSTSVGL